LVGCDLNCFSTKVYDSCGVCAGPGPVGCDHKCFSTLVVDSCGVCGGGNPNCTLPEGSVACGSIVPRGGCGDLTCATLNSLPPGVVTVPKNGGTQYISSPPPKPADVVTLILGNITGFYNIDKGFTGYKLWMDSLNVGQQALACRISYDWTGDGIWDRLELFNFGTPNDLVDWEAYVGLAKPPPAGNLVTATGDDYKDLVAGSVRLELWSAFSPLSGHIAAPIYVMSDSIEDGEVSTLAIPYITVYSYPRLNQGNCTATFIGTTGTTGTTGSTGTISNPTTAKGITTANPTLSQPTSGNPTTKNPSPTVANPTTTMNPTTQNPTTRNPTTTANPTTANPSTTGDPTTALNPTTGPDACYGVVCTTSDPCRTATCMLLHGTDAICKETNVANGADCEINKPPSLCYKGTCFSGKCTPKGDSTACEVATILNASDRTVASVLVSLLAITLCIVALI